MLQKTNCTEMTEDKSVVQTSEEFSIQGFRLAAKQQRQTGSTDKSILQSVYFLAIHAAKKITAVTSVPVCRFNH
jgi:hypothetical protein